MQEKYAASQRSSVPPDTYMGKGPYLASYELFLNLDAVAIGALERAAMPYTYPAGRILYQPGEKGNALFLLREGIIQLYHLSADGRKLIIATLEAGTSFGEMALIGQHMHDCFAEAMTMVEIYALNTHDVEQVFEREPAAMQALLQKIGKRLIGLESQLVDTTFRSVLARLASLLLYLAESSGNNTTQTLAVMGLSHEDLADHLGVYRETVSSTLRELKDAGTIELGRKHITICNPELLREIANAIGKSGRSMNHPEI